MKKYFLSSALIICICSAFAQVNFTGNQSNQMPQQMTNIANNPVNTNLTNDNINASENNNPPVQQQIQGIQQVAESNQEIEPSLDNGFHIRFQINAPTIKESTNVSSHSSYHKTKKTFNKKRFNRRNRIKNLLPKRKVSYNTYLCSRF